MPELHDPLRLLFREAAATGQARAESAPVSRIAERGRLARRRRIAACAACACLFLGGTGAAVAGFLTGPGRTGTSGPADAPPVPETSSLPSPSGPSAAPSSSGPASWPSSSASSTPTSPPSSTRTQEPSAPPLGTSSGAPPASAPASTAPTSTASGP
ncbi:hypothetical protein ABT112_00530 [Streptomyces sp. NPDC002055]|uniref:hypothetical protein n=1 Tax=Streptomyces sp. NPDC002055 TaxID=3154534 RepID=UPI0033348C7E